MKDFFIEFTPTSELSEMLVPSPKPARNYLPNWYREANVFTTDKPVIDNYGTVNSTFKMCTPLNDGFSFGYIQESWQEIKFDFTYDKDLLQEFKYYYPSEPAPIKHREPTGVDFFIPEDFHRVEFVWHPQWSVRVPKGYSVLYTHPLNRNDLPFYTLSGVIDADEYSLYEDKSNFPFYIKRNFVNQILPKGTPIYQIIPFKRDDWKSELRAYNKGEQLELTQKLRQFFWKGYKKTYWKKKNYN